MNIINNLIEWFQNLIPNFLAWFNEITVTGIGIFVGNTLVFGGSIGEFVGMLMIVVGLFLIKFKITKVIRNGFVIYLTSLLCELIGLSLI